MILCINYADEKFRPWQQLQTRTAYLFGADKVIEYSPKDIIGGGVFYSQNKFILDQPRGAGYWLWKPYIIKDALSKVDFGDYIFYVDSGVFYIHDIHPLIDDMENSRSYIMVFGSTFDWLEKTWTKRDTFILMGCDDKKYADTPQCIASYIVLKKTPDAIALIEEFLEYSQDPRIITDIPNQLGKENYPSFKDHRHDQSILSLLTKKKDIGHFRDPSQYAEYIKQDDYPKDVFDRSNYPPIFYHHRRSVGFNRTIGDFLQIYANEPRLCEGMRTAKYLIQKGMVKEAYAVLLDLDKEYNEGNDEAWLTCWNDLRYIFFKHRALGSPYARTFLPCLCKLCFQIMRRRMTHFQINELVYLVSCIEDKNLIPKDFQIALAQFVGQYINLATRQKLPPYMLTAQEMMESYKRLNMPIQLTPLQ